jgi:hypothetical protein
MDFETWPEGQKAFASRVMYGILDGDLQPLADYLRAGHYIHPRLAHVLIDVIENNDVPFQIVTVGARGGQPGMTKQLTESGMKMATGVFMEDRFRRFGRADSKNAARDAAAKFGVSERVAITARRELRELIRSYKGSPAEASFWENLKDLYLVL